MRLRWILLIVTALRLLGTVKPAHTDGVDDYLKAQMAAQHIPGLSVAVVQDGTVVKTAAYGLSDAETKTPATLNTLYGLGSCTKPFTAVAVLQLMEAGKVSLDAPISRYLDGLPAAWNAITVRELLTHTSGLPNYRLALDFTKLSDPKYKQPNVVVALLAGKPLDFPPGTRFEYSNTNYHLLGRLIEKVSGQSYGAYLASHQFQAAGMTRARLSDPPARVPNQAVGYDWNGKTRLPNATFLPGNLDVGDSGLLSTSGDLVKWTTALASGRLVSDATLKQMITPGTLTDGTPVSYGLGLVVSQYKGQTLVGHSGAVPGYSSSIFYFPDSKLTVIVLCNLYTGTPLTDVLALEVAKRYLPAAPPEAAAPDADPAVTRLLRRTLTALASGKIESGTLTPEMRSLLTPQVVAQSNQNLAALGTLTTLSFLTRTEQSGLQVYRYRAVYGTTPVIFQIALTQDSKIAGLSFHLE